MRKIIIYSPIIASLICFALLYSTYGLTILESIAVSVFTFSLFNFIKKLSNCFVFLDIIILIASLQWLLGPVLAYQIFNKQNKLALLWDTYMKVPSDQYFAFVLPGTILFILGLKMPLLINYFKNDEWYIENAKNYLREKGYISLLLVGIGFNVTLINPILPHIVQGIFHFFAQLTFIGVFYAIFSEFKYKKTIVLLVLSLLILQCILTGMYGELIYWSLLTFILAIIGNRISFISKIIFFCTGLFFILMIQSIKHEYRAKVWDSGMVRNNDASLFGKLVWDKILHPSQLVEPQKLFDIAIRVNQGFLIAKTMEYVPKHEPFAHGETILKSAVASFIPRIFWHNKPTVGGRDMIVRFLGAPDDLEYSYNLSPIGEAYVNFGVYGGIVFMFFYGLFFNMVFLLILKMSIKLPSIIMWLPIILIGPIQSMEGDILEAINTLVKASFFCWMMYQSFRILFKIRL
jgi:hypothetical protein